MDLQFGVGAAINGISSNILLLYKLFLSVLTKIRKFLKQLEKMRKNLYYTPIVTKITKNVCIVHRRRRV